MSTREPQPLDWISLARELKSIAEAGLRFGENVYDLERYQRLHELASLPVSAVAPEFRWPVEAGYATPKVDVRAVVFDAEKRVLLVREALSGEWTLPGGWADLNHSPAENVAKEVREEAGFEVVPEKLIACWDKDRRGHPRQPEHVYKLVFLCRLIGGAFAENHETSGAEFFSPDALPALCPHRAGRAYIELGLEHLADPALPTEFD